MIKYGKKATGGRTHGFECFSNAQSIGIKQGEFELLAREGKYNLKDITDTCKMRLVAGM